MTIYVSGSRKGIDNDFVFFVLNKYVHSVYPLDTLRIIVDDTKGVDQAVVRWCTGCQVSYDIYMG